MSLNEEHIDQFELKPRSEPDGPVAEDLIDTEFLLKRLTALEDNMHRGEPVYEPWHKRRAPLAAKRPKYPVCGQIKDVDGGCWDVRDVRHTRHGFDLCFGTPADAHASYYGGLPRLIATKALWDFWDANRTRLHGFLFDLPAGRTTLKRLRRRLGFNFHDDTLEFWTDHSEDLDSLPVREFGAKYEVEPLVAYAWRRRILGIRARPIGWWRKAKFLKVLLSGLTLIETGRKLGIGTTHAKRLRDRARLEAQLLATPVCEKVSFVRRPEST